MSAVLCWHCNCCDDTECCVDIVTAVMTQSAVLSWHCNCCDDTLLCCVGIVTAVMTQSAVLSWHCNCCDDAECCVDIVTAVVQVDKLEQSEAVRSEEEQKAEDRPIVLGEYCGLALSWFSLALLSRSRHYTCHQLCSILSCCCLVLSVVDNVTNFWKLGIFTVLASVTVGCCFHAGASCS